MRAQLETLCNKCLFCTGPLWIPASLLNGLPCIIKLPNLYLTLFADRLQETKRAVVDEIGRPPFSEVCILISDKLLLSIHSHLFAVQCGEDDR